MLSIVIVSFNTKDLLLACLRSVVRSKKGQKIEIIVIDNGSTDGTQALIRAHFPQVILIENNQNMGFGAANNQGANSATYDYLLFLNSDTELQPDAIKDIFYVVQTKRPKLAAIKLLNRDFSIQPQGGHLPNLINIFAWMFFIDDIPLLGRLFPAYQIRRPVYFTKDRRLGWVGGTAMIAERQSFQMLGGFDPKIFMYGEDVEICYRAAQAGITVEYFSKPSTIHHRQGSGTTANSIIGEYTGLIYLFSKHKSPWQLPILKLSLKIGALLRLIIFGIMGGNEQKRRAYHEAYQVAR